MRPVRVVTTQPVSATVEQTFDAIVPIDLTTIFTGYGPFPAVVDVRDQPGKWDAAGKTRTVVVRGGGFMRERALQLERPNIFAYEVVPTKGPLVHLVERINGEFVFEPDGDAATTITWTYDFVPKRRTRPLIALLAPFWRRYALRILAACAAESERLAAVAPLGEVRDGA